MACTTIQRILLLLVVGIAWSNVGAENVEFSVLPDKCISVRKGQKCYQRLDIRWRTETSGQVCLWEDSSAEPLKCWNNVNTGRLRYNFMATETKRFRLIDTVAQVELAFTDVKVSWVYNSRSRKRTRWRLF